MLLIDSTIYVDWLRRRVEPQEIIEPWIRARELAICGVIRAEVIRGVIDPRQKTRITELFDVLEEAQTDSALWHDASELAWRLNRRGTILPLTDIVIAACARRINATLITLDHHFSKVPGLRILGVVPRIT
jgi:predicted nucleic acid-binding protein